MTKNVMPLVVALAWMSVQATALPPVANTLLQGSLQSLRCAGYAGLEETQVPTPPAAQPVAYTAADTTSDALAGLIRAAQSKAIFIPETARALGFEFEGDTFMARSLPQQSTLTGTKLFSVADFQGQTVVIIEIYSKTTKELRSFRASADGSLQAAALTTKSAGKFQSVAVSLPNSSTYAEFEAELGFWTQYYRDHLKH
jgi:hypothetical protein